MNRDYMANMLFNINDVVETLKREPINAIDNGDETVSFNCDLSIDWNKDDWDQIKEDSPRNGKYLSLLDLPQDDDAGCKSSTTAIGDLLHDLQIHINELHDYFSKEESHESPC
tara:strand:+ start:105 stop:443 length:339 start_codon:yes stop_codon:yes gene_type:complete